jgi:branched-chain amino acid transport system permease protein
MSPAALVYVEFVGVFILLLWAVYLPFRGGQLYNGPFYCMAIGAYTAAYFTKMLGWPGAAGILMAMVAGAIAGFLPALAFSKTTGIVTATASMALIFIIQAIIRNLDFIGGGVGLWGIPRMAYLPFAVWLVVIITGLFVYRIDRSRVGRALEAMRTDPSLASSLGMNLRWLSVFVMTFASVIGAIAGAFYAYTVGTIIAESFGFTLLLSTMTMLFIGGRYTMWGILVSAPLLWGIPQWIPPDWAPYTNLMYGALLVIVLVVRPEGLVSREMIDRLRAQFKHALRRDKAM